MRPSTPWLADVDDLRISVVAGPVLREDDRVYREVALPQEFWKVVAWAHDGAVTARAFVLTQDFDGLEALDTSDFETYQVTLAQLTERIGVTIPGLAEGEDARRVEAVAGQPLRRVEDIRW
ncbi:DNA/RNA non-specific endonuclease [Janibacter hoylei]|uniref:DNA/RNA non-specific endonuclease n=1 Tax=Janibacter hoylei TaxID=364298 RepID=UPI0036D127E4